MELPQQVATWLYGLDLLSSPSCSLPAELRSALLHGSFFQPLFSAVLGSRISTVPDISGISASPTPAAKLTNWATVFKVCAALDLKVPEEQRLLILAGDLPSAIGVLTNLCIRLERGGRKPKSTEDGSLFIESLDVVRPLAQADSCLEFLLLSLCQAFRLKPRQAAGLLTQSNKYLTQILERGLKTDFQPVLNWVQSLQNAVSALILLLAQEDRAASILVLSAFRPGLLSRNEAVAKETAVLFRSLLPPLALSNDACWHWFIGPHGGLEACIAAVKRFGDDFVGEIVEVINAAARFKTKELLTNRLKAHTGSVEEYLKLLADIVPRLLKMAGGERLVEEGVLPLLTETALREADTDPKRTTSTRYVALSLLCILWKTLPQYYGENESVVSFTLTMLKKACRDKSLLSFHSAALLFDLLRALTIEKNHLAPQLFKSLTFLLIETYDNLPMREFLTSNWTMFLRETPGLPVATLVEPLCKHLSLSYTALGLTDLDLLDTLATHTRLGLEQAVLLTDICGKQCLSAPHLSMAARKPLLRLAERFIEAPVMQEFLFRYLKLGLGLLTQPESQPKPMQNSHKRVVSAPVSDEFEEKTFLEHQKRIISRLTTQVIAFDNFDLNTRLKALLVKTILELKKAKYDYHKGLMKLLTLLGSPADLLGSEGLQPGRSPKRLAFLATPAVRRSQPAPVVLRSLSKKNVAKQRLRVQQSSPTLLNHSQLEIVKVREVDCSEEENSDLQAVLKMHSRLLKQLYRSYCGSSYAKGPTDQDTFEQQGSKKTLIREAELYKLLRDNGLSSAYLLKEQFSSLLRSYCVRYKTQEPTAIDYDQYVDMVVQIALYVYARAETSTAFITPAVAVMLLFQLFRQQWKETGRNLALFDAPYLLRGDRDTLLRLNDQIGRNPSMELPEGYGKTTRVEVELRYDLPAESGVKESYRIAMEVLDSMVSGCIGTHLLPPRVTSQAHLRVRAVGPTQSSPQIEPRTGPIDSLYRNPGLRVTMMKLQHRFSKHDLQEVAKVLDDILNTLEMQQTNSPRLINRAIFLREQREKALQQEQLRAEMRRRRRHEELEELLAKAKEAKRKRLRRERHRKRKSEAKLREAEIQKVAMRKQEIHKRARELMTWMQQKQAENFEKRKVEIERQQAVEAARKLRRQTFMKKTQVRLQQLLTEKTNARKMEIAKMQEAAKLAEEKKEAEKRRGVELLEQEKLRREEEIRMKQDLATLSTRTDITSVLQEHHKSLEVLYDYYAKVYAKDPKDTAQLTWQGLYKLSLHFLLLPELISMEDLSALVRSYDKNAPVAGIGFEQFTQCLVKIAAVGQKQLTKETQPCSGVTVKALLTYMELPVDSRRVVEVVRHKVTALPLHQRDRKRLVQNKISSLYH